ncbi:MAG TPA: glucokinase [Casimicrobiaceae bacterium]
MILAADVGGTKTLIQAGGFERGRWRPRLSRRYRNSAYPHFGAILKLFLRELKAKVGHAARIERACLAVAGPVQGRYVELTNRPWRIDAMALARDFAIARLRLVNDFEAAADGIDSLEPRQSLLSSGECRASLWRYLFDRSGRVTGEDIVSGPGLARIHAFVRERAGLPEAKSPADPGVIAQLALDRANRSCVEALELFLACYGAVAGDHAFAVNARAGVYLAGGIAPRILPRFASASFLAAFNAKGAQTPLANQFPIYIVTDETLAATGAALLAGAPR